MRASVAAAVAILTLAGIPCRAAGQDFGWDRGNRSPGLRLRLSAAALYSVRSRPFVPDEWQKLAVRSSGTTSSPGVRVGLMASGSGGALEIAIAYWWRFRPADYRNIRDPDSPYPDTVLFTDVSTTLLQADLTLHLAPWAGVPLAFYGFLGLGAEHASYTVAESIWETQNGLKEWNDFQHSFGLGVRLAPARQFSLLGELRLVGGPGSTSISNCHDEGATRVCTAGSTWIKYSPMLSIGAFLAVP